ncbi:hypothetical protein EUGRSUZ_I02622 [Eucalyptus grandis]|uniref:Uncharacterized protein n=2 Tax=Eucalyptus grandis TaxID=71139 RepID=A0ACC3JLP5_EUCGR|nr:hypothetical protein EUGRSUZ_I02622 [Eucalyptus grandis]
MTGPGPWTGSYSSFLLLFFFIMMLIIIIFFNVLKLLLIENKRNPKEKSSPISRWRGSILNSINIFFL